MSTVSRRPSSHPLGLIFILPLNYSTTFLPQAILVGNMSISTLPKVVLCTGANRGLGFQILHVGGLRKPSDHYVLACREVSSGNQALGELRKLGVKSEIEVLQLDVTNDSHIIKAVEHVKTKHGRLDGKLRVFCPED